MGSKDWETAYRNERRQAQPAAPSGILGRMSEASKKDFLKRKDITFLHYSKLKENPFQQEVYHTYRNLDALAADIAKVGIDSPLLVTPTGERESYYIISGHRRLKAFQIAVEKYGYTGEGGDGGDVPCIVMKGLSPEEMKERLILENLQRDKTDFERMNEVYIYWQLANERHKRGELKRAREEVERRLGVTPSTITRAVKVFTHLIPELLGLFEAEIFGSYTAYKLAKLDEDTQKTVYLAWTSNSADGDGDSEDSDADEKKVLTQQKIFEIIRAHSTSAEELAGGSASDTDTAEQTATPKEDHKERPSTQRKAANIGPINKCTSAKSGIATVWKQAEAIQEAINASPNIDEGIEVKLIRRLNKILALQAEVAYELKLLEKKNNKST